ncbi:Ig-like domain-containing protein [Streptomyces somaliensis DSM 40738]|uniref:L,D-transpeptidase n=1 Tax=Streptomyces somaliensis (strain ATCC 33201 / DSM 40738 / JCM 12659 / KCTC 9044 / NCTC 11332 / NRRL B-12077 / IP 733) TaxID=1134445 RepID=A0AA44ICT6_STRE0|nr:Ig-like domain-containing protein [Streptomyces somaliensis]MCQ0022430.1 Ig-like domain-containing protein [Streptomyces somaliensis DSM 40738]NKY13986.1 L,D-transpeptidase [Streptomyces somaliensis DSM 40738]
MSHKPILRTALSCSLLAVAAGTGLAGCGGPDGHPLSAQPYDAARQVAFDSPAEGREVPLDRPLTLSTEDGDARITDVTAVDESGHHLAGELSADGDRWRSTGPLAAGARYTVRVATENADGAPGARTLTFRTAAAKKLLKVDFGPEAGKYGVGQPLTATLSAPVATKEGRAAVERALKVRSTPSVTGAWHWVDDRELHFRPREYWPAGAIVTLTSNLAGLHVGGGVYGTATAPLRIDIGDRVEAVTDAAAHRMVVKRNGEVINTIPVTTGKPGFATRNGVKVVLEKQAFVRMRSTTVGIAEGSSESYDLPVHYATRVTWSGEYVHAAPWSVGSQGYANVSHGCVGMSTSNAAWFFENIRRGDIVRVVNSQGEEMTPFGNGFGDWNLSWDRWRRGSAVHAGTREGADPARLRPRPL